VRPSAAYAAPFGAISTPEHADMEDRPDRTIANGRTASNNKKLLINYFT
jgi:hypothetical protein